MPSGQRVCDSWHVRRTVLIVDDHAPFRSAVRAVLEAGGFEVVGEAVDGKSGIAEADRLRPEIVLVDVYLPDLDGFSVAASLVTSGSARPTIVLTSSRSVGSFRRRLAANPTWSFIPKSDLSGEALAAVVG
jgi:DNA-binding NarL/FixJ family response regulator